MKGFRVKSKTDKNCFMKCLNSNHLLEDSLI